MKTCPIPREVLTDFAQLLENLSLLLFLNGRRPPAGDDTGALHIPSLHPSARLGNITQIEESEKQPVLLECAAIDRQC